MGGCQGRERRNEVCSNRLDRTRVPPERHSNRILSTRLAAAAFRECWNGYFLIPIEDRGMHARSDLKECRETSAAEGIKGNVRAAELAASLYTGNDEKKKTVFFFT